MTAPSLKEALEHARMFIENGVELGYIKMPDADTPDPAHKTLSKIIAALATFQPSGEKREAIARALWETHDGSKRYPWAEMIPYDREQYYTYADTAILASGLVQDEAGIRAEPTDAQVRSACMSFRHDYGLLPEDERESLNSEAREWLYAWQKEGFAAIRSARNGGEAQ